MAAAPATGATTMLPPAGATCGGGASDAAPSSLVTTCRSFLLCGTAQRAAWWSVAGEVAAAAAAISAYLAAAAADGDRVAALAGRGGGATAWHTYAASLHSATAAPRTTGPGALCRWPSGAGGVGADATSLPPATNDGAAPPGTAPHNAAWQPAAVVVAAAAAQALPARSAVEMAADGAMYPCLSAAARAAAATTPAAWAAGGPAPAVRPLMGTPAAVDRQPAPSIGVAVGCPPPRHMACVAVLSRECEVPPSN